MQKTTTLTTLRLFFGKMLPMFILLAVLSVNKINAQYVNGNLGTGTLSKSGVAAPAGTQWHEMQNDVGNTTQTNVSIAFDASPIFGSSRVADNFVVPATDIWNISKMTFYAVVLPPPPGTSPVTAVRVVIRNASPVGASTVIFGDLTTNRLSSTSFANIYTIANSQVPAPGTVPNQNFVVWKVEADVPVSLTPGNYWVEWQLVGGAGQRVFALMSQPVGARTAAGYNGANTFNNAPWAPTLDGGNPGTAPDVPVDYCFGVTYTVSPCTSPTASVLSEVGYPTPSVSLINQTFTTAIPLPAGWVQQNLSSPVGPTAWFQGNTGVFPGNTPPGYIAANFNNTTGTNTISNWLFAPNITMKNGDSLSFFTRTTTGQFPDRLQVRRSQNGASTNAGGTNTSVGDFTDLLLDINPTYTTTGYPTAWTKFTVIMSGLPPAGVSGRIAFRYFVENAGPGGANSDYIGVDDVLYRTPGVSVPPNTCLGSTTNLKVDITGGIAPYTVVINTVPPTTPITVTNYQSGANIPVSPIVTTQYTLTSVTGCGVGTGNSGTPTVVVNPTPFPPLFIEALPDAPLCLGDPTLLTVKTGVSPLPITLYSQSAARINGAPSQTFPDFPTFSSQSADDFTVPAGPNWIVTRVTTGGLGAGIPTSVLVNFHSNTGANLPGAIVATRTSTTFTNTAGNYVIDLPSSVTLTPGTYWVSVVVNMSFGTSGQWFWGNYGAPIVGNEYAFQNPGGGFGTPCTAWGYGGSVCGVGGGAGNRNLIFSIVGTNGVANPLPPGYSFLWSPPAGLSNPTANPVGASPMNTTTYTVLVTAPGGCQGTATKTVIVNQPPTVTTQPSNGVVCATGSVSFSVVATGAGPLTYQWQEQVGGVGAWNPLANVAPYSNVTTPTMTINPVSGLLNGNRYRCIVTGICNPAFTSNAATLSVNALPVVPITPAGPVCGGVAGINGTQLTAGSVAPPVPGSQTFTSGTINVAIPEGNFPTRPATAASNVIAVSGIPANATITNITARLNANHPFANDIVAVLKSPTGAVINLDAIGGYANNAGANYVNTGFTLNQSAPSIASGTAPFTGTWRADLAGVTFTAFGFTLSGGPVGFDPTTTSPSTYMGALAAGAANGNWTLAAYDAGAPDIGNLTRWDLVIDYTTPGTGTGAVLTYVWSPTTGLYNDPGANSQYTGTNSATVYAAPTALTTYTVTATNTVTGCVGTNTVVVNYTPPAPNVTPNPVTMCLGDPAVKLRSSSVTSTTVTATSAAALNIAVPDNTANGINTSLTIGGIPSNANLADVSVKFNMPSQYPGDLIINLRAPNGKIVNVYKYHNGAFTGPAGGLTAGWFDAITTYNSTILHSAVGSPWRLGQTAPTGPFKMDRLNGLVPGTVINNPAGFNSDVVALSELGAGTALNGTWTLAIADGGPGDISTLTNWELKVVYAVGVPSTPAVWSPATGLFSDAIASTAYVAGTAVDSVWAKPTTIGANNYQVTVQSVPVPDPANPASIAIPSAGNGTPYPSNINVVGYPTTGVSVLSVRLVGVTHTWGDDIDILVQSPTGQNVVLMSDVGGQVAVPNATYVFEDAGPAMSPTAANPSGTYRPTNNGATDTWPAPGPGSVTQATPTIASFGSTSNVNGLWKLFVVDDTGGDLGSISGGWSIKFNYQFPACTSPARNVLVTVNQPVAITSQPVNTSVCTDKVTTFSVVATGTGLTYQWERSLDNGTTWTPLTNGAPYSGVTTNTLTVTAPSVTLNGTLYRVVVSGAAPCLSMNSSNARLTVNPLPTIVIQANPYTKLFPGLSTTISSSSSPAAATYIWKKNGTATGATTSSITLDVDGMGDYTLMVTDVNGCVNTSNTVTISDSASGKIFIYPNPNGGTFQVRYYSGDGTRAPRGLNIYDDKGARIMIDQYNNTAPYSRMDVDLRKHGKGIYWVEVVDGLGARLAVGRAVVL